MAEEVHHLLGVDGVGVEPEVKILQLIPAAADSVFQLN
jgi:hypothetical protein